jgi:hypothetical protein
MSFDPENTLLSASNTEGMIGLVSVSAGSPSCHWNQTWQFALVARIQGRLYGRGSAITTFQTAPNVDSLAILRLCFGIGRDSSHPRLHGRSGEAEGQPNG